MRIEKIILENFAGIFAGTHKTKIEIDFSNNKNNIIVLNAGNGSGKTTLLSLLHPLRGTFDSRTDIVLKGEVGHSKCWLSHNGHDYITEHFYGKSKNKSFFMKDGIELNENGTIKSFNKIAYEELGIDEEYFKIGRIGNNVSNFIDQKTTDRKKFMNHYIPSIDEYLEAYDIVKSKYTLTTQSIKKLTQANSFYKGIDEMKDELNSIDNSIESYNKSIKKREKDIEKIKTSNDFLDKEIRDLAEDYETNDIIDVITNFEDYEFDKSQEVINNTNIIIALDEKFPQLSSFTNEELSKIIKEKEFKVNTTSGDINRIKFDIKDLQNKIISINNDKYSYETKKENMCNEDIDVNKLEVKIKENNVNINDLKNKINSFEKNESYDSNYVSYLFENKSNEKVNFENFIDSLISIKSNYSDNIVNSYLNIDINESTKRLDEYNASKENYESALEENDKELSDLNSKLNFVDSNLSKRPDKCKIDSCEFIKSSVLFNEKERPKIIEIENENENFIKEINNLNKEIEFYTNILNLNKEFKDLFKSKTFSSLSEYMQNYLISLDRNLLTSNISSIQDLFFYIFDNVDYYLTLNSIESENEILNSKVNSYKSSQELYETYVNEIKRLNDEANSINNDIDNKYKEIEVLNNNLIKYQKQLKVFESYYDSLNKVNTIRQEYEVIKNCYDKISEKYNTIKENYDKLSTNEEELKVYEKNLNELLIKQKELNKNISIVETNLEEINKLNETYDDLKEVKEALDPKTGIPIVFINNYLKSISVNANNLLKIAYGDKFKIKFDVTATDFNIEVYKSSGTYLSDISQASQGEVSLTNISLSLSMLQNMVKKYNIIYLDEIDATLSSENRRLFIDMLEKQIETLGIEQCFIITHNNEFYNKNVDLILLKDHDCPIDDDGNIDKEFLEGKNIIYKL